MTQTTGLWTGALVAPLPVVLITIGLLAITVGISETLVIFVVLAYAIVLLPLGIAYGIADHAGWRRLRAYSGMMFLVSFAAVVVSWQFLEFSPDSKITIEYHDGVERPVPLPIIGVVAAFFVGLLEAICMALFWHFTIRPRLAGAGAQ